MLFNLMVLGEFIKTLMPVLNLTTIKLEIKQVVSKQATNGLKIKSIDLETLQIVQTMVLLTLLRKMK